MPPSKFTEANRDKLLENLRTGMPLKPACAGAGIGSTTLTDWRAKARAAAAKRQAGEDLADDELAYAEFDTDIEDAIAAGHAWLYGKWLEEAAKKRGEGNWLPYEKMLERRFREDYRLAQRIDHATPDDKPMPVEVKHSVDDLARIASILAGAGALEAPVDADPAADPVHPAQP